MEQQKNIPSMRFPEFSGDWVINLLSDIAEKRIIKNKDNKVKNVFTNSAIHGIVNQRDFFDKDIANQNNLLGYYLVENNDFVYNPRISNYAPVGPISRNHLELGIMSPLYSVFRFKTGNHDFIEMYFNTTIWHRHMEDIANYGARDDRMSFLIGDFYKMPINLPTIAEQSKIALFLTKVDEKLKALKKKKELLEQYKKGVMQQIFSQVLRFKDDNGNDYPDWVTNTLGEIAEIKKGKQLNKEELTQEGDYLCINGGISPSGYTDKFNTLENTITISEGGNSCGYVNFFTCKFWSGGHNYSLEIKNNEINNNDFIFQVLKQNQSEIMKLRVGSGLPNIQKKDLSAFELVVPNDIEEQSKIADFLSTIDNKISYCQSQIEKAEVWKKGLLQQMFC